MGKGLTISQIVGLGLLAGFFWLMWFMGTRQ